MASPADGMNLDNDNSRDGAASVTSMTPAPSPAQTPSPPMPTRGPLHSDPTRPPHLCQPCVGDDDAAFRDPGPGLGAALEGPAPAQSVRYERSFSSDSAVMTELPTPPSRPRTSETEYLNRVAEALGVRGFGTYRPVMPPSPAVPPRPPSPPTE